MFEHKTNEKWAELVSTFISLSEAINEAENSNTPKNIEQKADMDLVITQAKRGMEDTVTELSN